MTLSKIKKFLANLISGSPRLFDFTKSIYRFFKKDYLYLEILHFLDKERNASFVQIGSNDGLLNDPLREFIVKRKLKKGLLIEPIPFLYKRLYKNYSYIKNNDIEIWNGAVLSDGLSTMYTIKHDKLYKYPKTATQISSFDIQHIRKHFPNSKSIDDDIEKIDVRNISINEILNALEGTIDLLQIDIEGGEFNFILAFPFSTSKPKMIIYEFDHMTVEEKNRIQNHLEAYGYRVNYDKYDAVAYL